MDSKTYAHVGKLQKNQMKSLWKLKRKQKVKRSSVTYTALMLMMLTASLNISPDRIKRRPEAKVGLELTVII